MALEYQGYSRIKFDRLAQTTLAKHLTDLEDAHMREYAVPAQLQSAGRILYNQSGVGTSWPVQYRRHDIAVNTGANRRNFVPKNLWKKAAITDGGYAVTDSISEREILQNRGPEAIVNIFGSFMQRLEESLDQGLATQYWINGNEPGNEDFWDGFMSMYECEGTINITDGTQRDPGNAADICGWPVSKYAEIDCELGAYGGANETGAIWPDGDSDPEFDFWTPIVVVGSSTSLGATATKDWRNNCVEAIRFAITHGAKTGGRSKRPTTIVLARQMFMAVKNHVGAMEEVQVTTEHSLRALGFRDVLSIDGVEVTHDNSVPVHNGFGFNYENVEIRSLFGDLLRQEGPQYDMVDQSHKAVVSTLGNLKFKSPRNFFRLVERLEDL